KGFFHRAARFHWLAVQFDKLPVFPDQCVVYFLKYIVVGQRTRYAVAFAVELDQPVFAYLEFLAVAIQRDLTAGIVPGKLPGFGKHRITPLQVTGLQRITAVLRECQRGLYTRTI